MRFLTLIVLLISLSYTYAAIRCCVNESLNLCGRLCEPSCSNPKPNPYACPKIECTRYTTACRCNKGYLRNFRGQCIVPRDCRLRA